MPNTYPHPFQKLCRLSQQDENDVLLGALGPYILVLDLKSGRVLSKWPDETVEGQSEREQQESLHQQVDRPQDDESPYKRRRISPSIELDTRSQESTSSIEILSERTKGQRRKKKKPVKSTLPNISHIISTYKGEYIIAVTADDKCIRVFEPSSLGRLRVLSERCMPKRLCTIALTKSQKTILAGDKFGDVYALPLLPSQKQHSQAAEAPRPEHQQPFKTSASELTVHTKGNREALRQQQIQKSGARKKQEPTFEHLLVLGHVSSLTDLAVGLDPSNESREYILTADRDEHIRVSRGVPQAHIISNYCLGHTEFVSKLCILTNNPRYLISGGGELYLRVWDWMNGAVVADARLGEIVGRLFDDAASHHASKIYPKRAISCIRSFHVENALDQWRKTLIVVAVEGTPLLSTYQFDAEAQTLRLVAQSTMAANVLDIIPLQEKGLILVSLDSIHTPFSMKTQNPNTISPIIEVLSLKCETDNDGSYIYEWIKNDPSIQSREAADDAGIVHDMSSKIQLILQSPTAHHEVQMEEKTDSSGPYSQIGEFLYGLENLRKKVYGDEESPAVEV